MSAALSTQQLTKDYGDRPALLPLDLEVPHGQHVALVGHNGSGKTTLLRMAAGCWTAPMARRTSPVISRARRRRALH
jgi:sulfonate transport system ATP-binding protein